MIRVLVWAQSAITQAGLEAIVDADTRFETIERPARGRGVPGSGLAEDADVILLDGLLGSGDSARLPAMQEELGATPVVALADATARGEILRLLHAGVRGILMRDSPPQEITAAIEAASEGLAVVSPEVLEAFFPAHPSTPDEDSLLPPEPLTERESEVLALLAVGASNKEIAGRLHLSEHTVKFYVSTILSKLGAATRAEAVARGYREGLILM